MPQSRDISPELVADLAKYARLPLDQERIDVVTPELAGIYELIDQLDDVDFGDTPPATAFDARWK